MFDTFTQDGPTGYVNKDIDVGITHYTIIEAKTAKQDNYRARIKRIQENNLKIQIQREVQKQLKNIPQGLDTAPAEKVLRPSVRGARTWSKEMQRMCKRISS